MVEVEVIVRLLNEDFNLEKYRICYKYVLKMEILKTMYTRESADENLSTSGLSKITLRKSVRALADKVSFNLNSREINDMVSARNYLVHDSLYTLNLNIKTIKKEISNLDDLIDAILKYNKPDVNNNAPEDNSNTDMTQAKDLLGGISVGSKTNIMK